RRPALLVPPLHPTPACAARRPTPHRRTILPSGTSAVNTRRREREPYGGLCLFRSCDAERRLGRRTFAAVGDDGVHARGVGNRRLVGGGNGSVGGRGVRSPRELSLRRSDIESNAL